MPTVDERLRHVTLKVERAKQHVADLDGEIRRFLDTDPYVVGTKHDPQSRQLIYYVVRVEATPPRLSVIAGDVLQNLMSALDHLAYQLVMADTGDDPPPHRSRIYFPIARDAAEYETKKIRKIEGVRQETLNTIDAIKPYKGGNDQLWSLYQLNNVEKHRLLMTVGSMLRSVDVGAVISGNIAKVLAASGGWPKGVPMPLLRAFVRPGDPLVPLKAGDELFIDAPDAEVNEQMQFRFSVALCEPEVLEAQSLLETLVEFVHAVEGIVTTLTARLH